MIKKALFSLVLSLGVVGGMTACNEQNGAVPQGSGNLYKTVAPTLGYPIASAVFVQNVAISPLQPTVTGTSVIFSVSPALPAGLLLDASGAISGTPTTDTPAATYTVTASNASGSASFALSLQVTLPAPTNLSYASASFSFTATATLTPLSPTITGTVFHWSVTPALPAGLILDSATGALSGSPTTVTAAATYVVTATNDGGSVPVSLSIAVTPAPVLAHVASHVLTLHMGPNASLRLNGDLSDGDESFLIRHAAGDPCDTMTVEAFGISQKYVAVQYAVGNGGAGNNSIKIQDDDHLMCSLPVHFIAGTGSGVSSAMSFNGGRNILEGGPKDSLKGGTGEDAFIINVPIDYADLFTGSLTAGYGLDYLIVRPVSGNAYVKLSYFSLESSYEYMAYTDASLATPKSFLDFTLPAGINLAVAASDGTANKLSVSNNVPIGVELIGGLSSSDSFVLPAQAGSDVVLALSSSLSQITVLQDSSCQSMGASSATCSHNTYFVASDPTLISISGQSIYDAVNTGGNVAPFGNKLSLCAGAALPASLSTSCL